MTITIKAKTILSTISLLIIGLFAITAIPADAVFTPGTPSGALDTVTAGAGLDTATDETIFTQIGAAIKIVMGLLGVIFFLYLLYAGFLWMTSNGDTTKIDKAKGMIINSVIGIAIILSALAISTFVLNQLVDIT